MVHSMALKNVSVESYKATIRTFRSSLVERMIFEGVWSPRTLDSHMGRTAPLYRLLSDWKYGGRFTLRGDTLEFSYIRRLGSFLRFKILNFNIIFFLEGEGVIKNVCFLDMKILWIFFWVITKLDYI